MKKSILFLLLAALLLPAHASKMCVDSNAGGDYSATSIDSWQVRGGYGELGIGCKTNTTTWTADPTGQTCIGRCLAYTTVPCGKTILVVANKVESSVCKCRLIYPFVGPWVVNGFRADYSTECPIQCAYAAFTKRSTDYMQSMFGF
jgi:hypothetical protein